MSRTNRNNIVQVLGWLSCALLLAGLLTAPARASNFTWTNTADGTSGYWTNGLLWNPGGPGSYPGSNTTDNAYLTNNTAAGAVYTNILNFSLPTALNTLAISNSTGGTAWLIVTNATLINTTNTIGNGGVLQIDNGGLVSNTTAFNWRGTNGVIYLNSGGQLKTAANVTIGNGISNVTATVSSLSGAGNAGRWDFGGKSLSVGNGAATGIVLTVNAVTLTNLNTLSISGTSGNTLTASNGAQIAASFSILGTSNTFNMGGLGAQSAFTNSGGGFWVGQTGGGYNQLTITNATFYITATSGGIGGSGGGTNTVTILANGSVSNGMTVGNGSPGNRLIVNGGTLNGNVTVGGNAANSYGSSLTVSNGGYLNGGVSVGLYNTANSGYNQFNAGGLGAPSIISMSNPSVGSGNSFNTMTVTNADVYGSQMNLGSATGSSNTVTVLTNGIFRGGGGSFYIGSGGGSSNSFNVIGGIATNWGINSSMYVAVGKGNGSTSVATSNALNISDGGLFNAGFVYVGYTNGDVYNAYNVGGVGAPSSVSNGTLIVGNGGASFSTLTVTNATLLAGGNVTIGSSASNNTASVYNGGTWNLLYKNLTVGSGAATGNVLTVTDGVLTNVGTLAVGVGGGWSNSFTISGAATVSVVKLVVTNDLATGNANQLTFAGGFLTVTNAYITNGVAFTIGNGVTAATLNEVGGFIGVSNGLAVANLGTITGWGTNSSPIQVSNSGNIFAVNGTLLFTNSAGSDATFGNAGTLGAAANSTLRFVGQIGGQLITNFGTINLNGGTLSSGVITNLSAGTVRGAGTLSNLVYNLGTVDATNGTLKFWNNLINANGATLNVRSDGIALITNATASLGVIFTNYSGATVNLRGGTIVDKEFVNQGQLNTYGGLISNALQNAGYWNVVSGVTTATPDLNNLSGGVITNAATLQVGSTGSGPVVNAGTLVLQGGTLLAGSVTNTSSGTFQLAPGGATSTSTVSNGTTFVNQGILSLAGGQTLILSGMTLTNAASGYVVGNGGTLVLNNASFFNQSQQNALWDMGSGSTLLFTNGASYTLTVAGTDNGSTVLSSPSTTNQNYFVSNLSVAGGTLLLTNWAGGPHALYVANLTLAPGASITNASGLTVYYGALNLNGGTTNGAFQIWTSGASPVWVFTNATGVSDWAAGNSWDQGTAPAGGTVQVWVTNAITAATALLYTNATSTITTFTLSNSTSFKHTLILSNGSLAISSPTLVGSNGVIQIGTGSAAATLTNATLTLASGGQIVMTNGQAGPVNKWVVTGALNSTAGSTITMAGASSASNLLLLTTAPFVNNGFLAALSGTNIIQASAVANAGTLAVQGGALLVQPTGGFFLNQAGGTIQITNGSLVVTGTLSNQAGAVLAPLANGTLTISGGALVMNGPYTNRGTTAFLNSLGTFTGNFVNSGAWTASASTNAIAGDLLIGSGAAGTLSAASAAYVTGVLTNFGTLNILSGSVLTNGNAFLAGPATVLVSDAGSVWSNAALNLGTGGTLSSVVVSNGGSFYASSLSFGASNNLFTLGGAGAMSAGTISTITLTNFAGPGVNQLTLSNSLLVHATVNLGNGGVLQIDNGGVASNTGTAFNWTGTNGVIYLNTGGELLTAGNVALGNGISNINATVSSLSPLGSAGVWDLLGKNLTIGTNAAVGNVLNVNAATLANVNKLFIGSSTSSWNSLVISNGASLVVTGAVNVGTSAGSSNNSYFVGGLGAVSFVTNALINVGTTSAGYNTMTVTNANFSSTGNVTIGNNSSNNTVTVLANAFWNLNGQQLYIGSDNNSTGNVLVINGGSVTNLGGGVVLKGVGNSLTVSNGGILWGPDLQMGGTSNTVTYGGAGALSVMSNLTFYVGANLGGLAGGGYDQMTITNATVVTGSGNHGIGAGSSNNTLTVLAGGTYIGGLYVGSGSTGNTLVVNGGTVTPIGQFLVTQNSDGFGNSVTISNGGLVPGRPNQYRHLRSRQQHLQCRWLGRAECGERLLWTRRSQQFQHRDRDQCHHREW